MTTPGKPLARDAILACLAAGERHRQAIIDACSQFSPITVSNNLFYLGESGDIVRTRPGVYRLAPHRRKSHG